MHSYGECLATRILWLSSEAENYKKEMKVYARAKGLYPKVPKTLCKSHPLYGKKFLGVYLGKAVEDLPQKEAKTWLPPNR